MDTNIMDTNMTAAEKTIWIVTAPFRILITLLRWFVAHPKMLIVCGLVGLAVIGVRACNAALNPAGSQVQHYQEIAPPVTAAPYVLATSSRVYYVAEYTEDGDTILLKSYYTYDAKKWQKSTTPLPIDKNTFGEYRLYEREK